MNGEVDMVMESLYTLLLLINYKEMVGYKANFVFDSSFDSTFGFNKHEAVLCSIIDKALEEIDAKTISGQWLNKTYDYRAKLAEAQKPWIIGAMVLLMLTLLLITVMFYRKRKTDRLAMETKIREQTLAAENTMLDTLNRMKNEFFQNMSHDLKTPLTVISTDILNAADYLDFDMDKDDMRNSLSHAQSEIMRMARMVDSALKYSTMQENKEDMEPMDIASLLREGAENYRAMLERNGNRLTLDIPPTLPLIFGNADTLLHVLSNLLSNANNYTRNGEIAIQAVEESGNISVTVRDSGAGVKPEYLPRIFERGVSDGGTGLGLSICKSAVEALGGDISAKSEYGHGTGITFILPLYKEDNTNG
jgi:signal transduction histidine kinase